MEISQIATLPTKFGEFKVQSFKENGLEHLVIFKGEQLEKNSLASLQKSAQTPPQTGVAVNVRIHSECLTGDALGSLKCDCGAQLAAALDYIFQHSGMVIYLRQEGRGIGLFNKINAYALQDAGLDTIEANHALGFEADLRKYDAAVEILQHFQVTAINLLTNNPQKISSVPNIVSRTPLQVGQNRFNEEYLKIKKEQMGHLLKV